MMKLKLFAAAAAALAVIALAPASAADLGLEQYRHHHRHHYHHAYWALPYHISYLHNYGPGPQPGTFAYYDGPTRALCKLSAAAYRGQDGRRHPCF
jgi:hypothetical protein